jgi:hypothetical protein
MALTQAIAVSGVQLLKLRLLGRMQALARETGEAGVVLPVALCLLADQAHGGEITAQELARHFKLADFEARNLVDFYFLGWSVAGSRDGAKELQVSGQCSVRSPARCRFDDRSYQGFRQALRAAGVRDAGGLADLMLVDASYVAGTVRLNFSTAIRLDLAAARGQKQFLSVGGVLQSLLDAIAGLRSQGRADFGADFRLSEPLGLAVARRSLLDWLFAGWGACLGARNVADLAVRDLGPDLRLMDL